MANDSSTDSSAPAGIVSLRNPVFVGLLVVLALLAVIFVWLLFKGPTGFEHVPTP
jgi:hypothetical protein